MKKIPAILKFPIMFVLWTSSLFITPQSNASREALFMGFQPVLMNWPFEKMDPPVKLTEGWIYTGAIQDEKGAMHKALDFTRMVSGSYVSFPVYSMGIGYAYQGEVESWGKFVLVRVYIGNDNLGNQFHPDRPPHWVDVLYAHLDGIPEKFPRLKSVNGGAQFPEETPTGEKPPTGALIKEGDFLGNAGISGDTHNIPQLHVELHLRGPEMESLGLGKRDPLGIYDYAEREGVRKYPQPGDSLKGYPHWFASDNPEFAKP